MHEAVTYVGSDAHRNLAIAVRVGNEATPTTWTVANEPRAIERFRRTRHRLTPGSRHRATSMSRGSCSRSG